MILCRTTGWCRTCSSLSELKRPEQGIQLFLRFILTKGVVTYGLELMLAIFSIMLACVIFSLFASSPPVVDTLASVVTMVWSYIAELVFNMLVLVGTIKMADHVVREMMGLYAGGVSLRGDGLCKI